MYYDRTASAALIEALKPSGPLAVLTSFAKRQHLADLQLRSYPSKSGCWATMYFGLTKLIDVHERNGLFWAKRGKHGDGWIDLWNSKRPAEQWANDGQVLDHFLRHAAAEVGARFTNEGAVQSMLCTRAAHLFSVVDREAVIGFESTKHREQAYAEVRAPLEAALPANPSLPWLKPKRFGGELDLLAIDERGRLLAIEVKPGSSTSGVTWAPLQAAFYAGLFRKWSETVADPASSLHSMLKQRMDLGLTVDPVRALKTPIEVVPIVAIGGDPSAAAVQRMFHVREALVDQGLLDEAFEIWQVSEQVVAAPVEAP